jgi:hypothetical protein
VGEEDMPTEKTTQSRKRDSDFLEEAYRRAVFEEGHFEGDHDFQFKEGAYFEAAVNMEEWL